MLTIAPLMFLFAACQEQRPADAARASEQASAHVKREADAVIPPRVAQEFRRQVPRAQIMDVEKQTTAVGEHHWQVTYVDGATGPRQEAHLDGQGRLIPQQGNGAIRD
jgi:hypothetical protein